MLVTSMATNRKTALFHIQGQMPPLLKVVAQIYLFGNTQTLNHWKKELTAILYIVASNVDLKKDKRLKKADIEAALSNMTLPINLRRIHRMLLTDDDYKTLRPRKDEPILESAASHLLDTLAALILSKAEVDLRDIAQELIDQILSW